MKYLTRTVWTLSLISLLTDTASEMLYPVLPIYLKSIGFTVVLIGVLEGIAEATAGLSKGYFGKMSDLSGKRVPFVQWGYALSAISKPMMAIFIFPMWIFFARTIDRFGKGIRTGARDALLSAEATAETKASVFGFHRSFDTIGAVMGPCLALVYLYYHPQDYKPLFYFAFIPGALAIIITGLLKDKKAVPVIHKPKAATRFFSFLRYWKESPAAYRRLVSGLILFTLINSSDVFLLLKAKQSGLDDTMVIVVYVFYNLVYALAAFPLGILADKVGVKSIFLSGLGLFALVYAGMSVASDWYWIFGLFLLYGIYAAATEGISKAWITNITEPKDTATAIGTYAGLQSIGMLIASSLTGFLWFRFGSVTALGVIAAVTLVVIGYFLLIPIPFRSAKKPGAC